MTLTAQSDLERAGIALTETKFTTAGGVAVYLWQLGSNFIGMGPGDPNLDLVLDEVYPFAAGSEFTNITTGKKYFKDIGDVSSGNIVAGTVYCVQGDADDVVTYNEVAYGVGEHFTGVAGVATYTETTGTPEVVDSSSWLVVT